jgi:hypothetical protein
MASFGGRCSALSDFVIIFHSYDYVSLLAPRFDIPVSLGDLLQRVPSIYDRSYLSRLNKPSEENQVFNRSLSRVFFLSRPTSMHTKQSDR